MIRSHRLETMLTSRHDQPFPMSGIHWCSFASTPCARFFSLSFLRSPVPNGIAAENPSDLDRSIGHGRGIRPRSRGGLAIYTLRFPRRTLIVQVRQHKMPRCAVLFFFLFIFFLFLFLARCLKISWITESCVLSFPSGGNRHDRTGVIFSSLRTLRAGIRRQLVRS